MAPNRIGWLVVFTSACAVMPARDQPSRRGTNASAPASCTLGSGEIAGAVTDEVTGARLEGALVVLQSTALPRARETQTNANGLYRFRDLPPGTYTVQVLYRQVDVAKVTTLRAETKHRMFFKFDADGDGIVCRLPASPYRSLDESLLSLDPDEAELLGRPRVRRRL